ncbi:hypothetical protein [Flavobacterium sp.]|uniref:hypothetical protein n=1 Tax=Flavobacterium sp. TaxID=239 RepID=UPI002FD919A0
MKTVYSFLFFFFFAGMVAATAQTPAPAEAQETAEKVETVVETPAAAVASVEMASWFVGTLNAASSATGAVKATRSLVPSKKEQYLQSGMSNKTLLIRSILRKADGFVNATV